MQQVNDLLDFEIDTPSDKDIKQKFERECLGDRLAELEEQAKKEEKIAFTKDLSKNQRKRINKKANKAII